MNLQKLYSYFIVLSFLSLLPLNAIAQERSKDYDLSKDQVFDLPPPEKIETRHLKEMNTVYGNCLSDEYSAGHRDCKCYAMAYLEERLKIPNVQRSVVETAIQKSCFDTKIMHGFYFNTCVNNFDIHTVDVTRKDPVSLCECYGEYVSDNVPNLPRITFKTMQTLQTRAYSECNFFN